jgi:tetratricopeptide (TPR) repeat protein
LLVVTACGAPAASGPAATPPPAPAAADPSDRSGPTAGVPDLALPDAAGHATARRGLARRAELARPSERPQLQARIAIDHLEEAEEAERAAFQVDDWLAREGPCPEGEALRARLVAQAQSARAEAIRILSGVVQEHPDGPDAPAAHYTLASALQAAGRGEEALPLLRTLIARWPDHELVPDALLDLGDAAFERADMGTAQHLYERIRAREPADAAADLRPYATYKLAWTHWNLANFEAAGRLFAEIARRPAAPDSPLGQLRRAALLDYVSLHAAVGRAEDAAEALGALAPEHATALLERLALAYGEAGKYGDAATVWGELLAGAAPCDPARLRYRLGRLRASEQLGRADEVVTEAAAWVEEAQRLPGCLDPGARADYERARAAGVTELRALAERWRREDAKATPRVREHRERLEALLEALEPAR